MICRKNVFVLIHKSMKSSLTNSRRCHSFLLTKSLTRPFSMSSEKSSSDKLWMPQEVVPEHIKKLLSPEESSSKRLNYVLAFIQIVRLLKTQKRTGWVDHNVPTGDVESISDHMYRMSIISLLITNEEVNKDKCVKIAIVHDLAETLVGDITPFDGVEKSEKSRREFETIKYLASIIREYNAKAAEEIVELWLDYEEIRCLEARYVKDIDKYEMIQQAWDYEQQFGTKHNLDMFYSARSAIKTPEISELTDELIKQRTTWLASQK